MIYEKVRQRTHGTEDEGKTVKHFFKYFDENGLGTLNLIQFQRALEVLGCTFTEAHLLHVFNKHAQKGKLDFEEFASFMAMKGTVPNPCATPQFNMQREPPHQIIHEIKAVIKNRGIYGIRGFVNLFKKFGESRNGTLNHREMQWVLRQNG